jgi:hypothetical protein
MNGPLFRLLLRRHRFAIALLAFVPVILGGVIGFVFPKFAQQRAFLKAFGNITAFLGQGEIDLLSPRGAFTMPFQHPMLLLLFAVVVAIPATGLPAGERGRKALDLLCAAPLSRTAAMGTVTMLIVLAGLLMGAAGMVGAFVGAWFAGELGSDIPWGTYLAVAGNVAALCICLGGGALCASAAAPDRGTAALWYGVGVVLFFIVDVTARMWKAAGWLEWCTPYGFHRPASAVSIRGGPLHAVGDTLWLLGLAVVLYGAALWIARRRTSV